MIAASPAEPTVRSLANPPLPRRCARSKTFFLQRTALSTVPSKRTEHHHLTIRPDHVWSAILSHFGCWLNKAAEDVRKMFLAHEKKKGLIIYTDAASRLTVDFDDFSKQMIEMFAENIVDPGLREWMLSRSSTRTETDTVVASVLTMGALQPFFSYDCSTTSCGIPSVTLMGVRSDWEIGLGDPPKQSGQASNFWQGTCSICRPSQTCLLTLCGLLCYSDQIKRSRLLAAHRQRSQ